MGRVDMGEWWRMRMVLMMIGRWMSVVRFRGIRMSCRKWIRMGWKGRSWGRQRISGGRKYRRGYCDNWILGKIRVTIVIEEFRIRWKVSWCLLGDGRCHVAGELNHCWTGSAVRWWTFKEGFWGSGRLATKNDFFGRTCGEAVDIKCKGGDASISGGFIVLFGVELRGFGRRDIELHTGRMGTTEDLCRRSWGEVRESHGLLVIVIIGRKGTGERW